MRPTRLSVLTSVAMVASVATFGGACTARDREHRQTDRTHEPRARGGGPLASPSARRSGLPPTAMDALGPLAAARCEREQRCGRVGEGKAFTDRHQCSQAVRLVDERSGFLRRCSMRIDVRTLDACVAAVASSSCEDHGLALTEVGACRATALCREL